MKDTLVMLLLVAASLIAPIALAQDKAADVTDMQALRAALKSDKKAFVASVMKLGDAEGNKFWPIYESYQRNLEVTSRRRVVAVEALLKAARYLQLEDKFQAVQEYDIASTVPLIR